MELSRSGIDRPPAGAVELRPVGPPDEGPREAGEAEVAAERLAIRALPCQGPPVAATADAPSSPDSASLGVPFLDELLAVIGAAKAIPSEWMPLTRAVFDVLGLGLGQGLQLLYANAGSPERFVRAAVAQRRGPVDPARVTLANELASGAGPGPERARLIAQIAAAPAVLGAQDWHRWREDGYVVIHDAAPPAACRALAQAIWSEVGGTPHEPESWYRARLTQGIMVALHQAPGIDEIHASPRIRRAFAELLDEHDLVMTSDRCGFSAPLRPGASWTGPRLHLDVGSYDTPIPLAVQGILYLTDTTAEQGALRLVPGFHRRIDEWLRSLPQGHDPSLEDLEVFEPRPIAAPAGALIIWHHALPHGPGPNSAAIPRIVHYLTAYPAPSPVRAGLRPPP